MDDKLRTLFKVGGKYTLYDLSSFAITFKKEIQITEYFDGNPVYKYRGKKKKFILPLETRSYSSAPIEPLKAAVFEGWDQPIHCDSEDYGSGRVMRGNACFNFIGPVGVIKEWIDAKQLNPHFDKTTVLAIRPEIGLEGEETVVYPELYEGGHAVIDRILNGTKQQQKEAGVPVGL